MGIRQRLVGSYLAVILITVSILEVFLIASVDYYYHYSVRRILVNQAEISAAFFQQYFSGQDVAEQSERLLRGFSQNTTAQVQIIDASGQLLQDNVNVQAIGSRIDYPDVREARDGAMGIWRGTSASSGESLLAVSYPLVTDGKTVGVVRYVASLTSTIATIRWIAALCIAAGLLVVAIVAVVSLFLSRTITGSIQELKLAADQMAEGDLSARAGKRYKDELGALADTLNTMASRLQRSDQLKNEFISSVSHEIRTPLTSIKGWAVTLKSAEGDSKELLEEGLDVIESESDRLTELVDELLDFSKLANGKITLSRGPVQLPELLRHVGTQLAPRASRLGLDLEVRAEDAVPVIDADANRLKQVLINLLDNAMKFTPPGGNVTVRTEALKEYVILTVEDTGAGIPEEDLGNVLQKFYKGNTSGAGSGLGLSICHEIVKLHGGHLKVESEPGRGTKVRVFLPRRQMT
ncbi:HAMP domain-containing histidine kinase [Paenibacillus thiaminolyticus]|uniref:HAMP domain-containing sensor histidine kinase n=1 Tax=Paenibacillus thiaminolyticus TaxID=49283 RepID=UPI00232D3E4B|nr:HAMP domain-containing sensor histidine kinase [Paenibacillus thiaminolyticus]WCF07028.1 HAMP domain-containing histidine kinase [Paenibacillus thiaminolyticus]